MPLLLVNLKSCRQKPNNHYLPKQKHFQVITLREKGTQKWKKEKNK